MLHRNAELRVPTDTAAADAAAAAACHAHASTPHHRWPRPVHHPLHTHNVLPLACTTAGITAGCSLPRLLLSSLQHQPGHAEAQWGTRKQQETRLAGLRIPQLGSTCRHYQSTTCTFPCTLCKAAPPRGNGLPSRYTTQDVAAACTRALMPPPQRRGHSNHPLAPAQPGLPQRPHSTQACEGTWRGIRGDEAARAAAHRAVQRGLPGESRGVMAGLPCRWPQQGPVTWLQQVRQATLPFRDYLERGAAQVLQRHILARCRRWSASASVRRTQPPGTAPPAHTLGAKGGKRPAPTGGRSGQPGRVLAVLLFMARTAARACRPRGQLLAGSRFGHGALLHVRGHEGRGVGGFQRAGLGASPGQALRSCSAAAWWLPCHHHQAQGLHSSGRVRLPMPTAVQLGGGWGASGCCWPRQSQQSHQPPAARTPWRTPWSSRSMGKAARPSGTG
jgi:hypothetical protein